MKKIYLSSSEYGFNCKCGKNYTNKILLIKHIKAEHNLIQPEYLESKLKKLLEYKPIKFFYNSTLLDKIVH